MEVSDAPSFHRAHSPLDWLHPVIPQPSSKTSSHEKEQILPSFGALYQNVWETLYGIFSSTDLRSPFPRDKSPKGSVDGPIQPLVDLINHHSSICTLSSCSGRVALFNPSGVQTNVSQRPQEDAEQVVLDPTTETAPKSTEASGKGRGSWVLVTHDILDADKLVQAFSQTQEGTLEQQPWILKFEPMLLHVAARSLICGQKLLQIALECGFRESGLVVTASRVTVAIRSHSLSLGIPLGCHPQHPLYPTTLQLRAWVDLFNQRLRTNWKQMDRLHRALETKWFQLRIPPTLPSSTVTATVSQLPALQLWNVATVAVPHSAGDSNTSSAVDIFAFGGYGKGPQTNEAGGSQRSAAIYRVSRNEQGIWDDTWELVPLTNDNDFQTPTSCRFPVEPVSAWPACQGMAACRWGQDWILLWGGRTSPTRPLDVSILYLFHVPTRQLMTPRSIQGDTPPPRWGHCLVELSDSRFLLYGGGNYDEARTEPMSQVYILHLGASDHVYWEQVAPLQELFPSRGRWYGTASVVRHGPSGDVVLFRGGLEDATQTKNSLTDFFVTQHDDVDLRSDDVWACQVGPTLGIESAEPSTEVQGLPVVTNILTANGPVPCSSRQWSRYGAATCHFDNGHLAVATGGLNRGDHSEQPLQTDIVQFLHPQGHPSHTQVSLNRAPLQVVADSPESKLDFGSMVHHSCVAISEREFVLVGGGANSFAFGDMFAASHHVVLKWSCDTEEHKSSHKNGPRLTPVPTHQHTATATTTTTSAAKTGMTRVLYVTPHNAKRVKTGLESLEWLDKGYRMQPAVTNDQTEWKTPTSPADTKYIAIPIVDSAWEPSMQDHDSDATGWETLVLGRGMSDMPFSTARFAAKSRK